MNNNSELLNLLENACNPHLLIDGDGQIVWQNQAARNFFALLEGETADIYQYFEPGQIKKILTTEHYTTLDVQFKTKTGSQIKQAVLVLDLSSGNPDSLVFLLSLFSRATEQSEINQRAQFLEAVAHDLKNPLGAIFGYADALLDTQAGSGLNETQQHVLIRVRSTALRCIEMVRNYQQLLELQSDAILPISAPLNLNSIVDGVVSYLWRPGIDSADLKVKLDQSAPTVKARRIQAERVFANLLGNAIKYTPNDKTITVSSWVADNLVYLSIHNDGTTIPADELPQLFDRYSRASSGQEQSGSGLGLHIVKQIMQRLGGKYQASSSPKDGTCFTVAFPIG